MNIDAIIPRDKQLHIAAGFIVAVATGLFGGSALLMLGMAALAGAAKEGYDAYTNARLAREGKPPAHDVDVYDALATIAGGAMATFIASAFGFV